MSIKRYLLIMVPIVSLVIIALIIGGGIEKYVYAACTKAVSFLPSDKPWKYQSATFSPRAITVFFSNGTDTAFCLVERNDLKWHVTGTGVLLDETYP